MTLSSDLLLTIDIRPYINSFNHTEPTVYPIVVNLTNNQTNINEDNIFIIHQTYTCHLVMLDDYVLQAQKYFSQTLVSMNPLYTMS